MYINRPIAYILTATDHGTMIINRQDYKIIDKDKGCGVGFNILKRSSIGADDVRTELALIDKRIKFYGTGVVAIDCGANIGVHTIELAKFFFKKTLFRAIPTCLHPKAMIVLRGRPATSWTWRFHPSPCLISWWPCRTYSAPMSPRHPYPEKRQWPTPPTGRRTISGCGRYWSR